MGGDSPLTDLGREQARRAGARLAALAVDPPVALWTSDLARAVSTAERIGEANGWEPRLHPGLREIEVGKANGLTPEEAAAIAQPLSEPTWDWVPFPGAESWGAMVERVWRAMDEIAADPATTAIVVAHAGSGSAAIQWWLQLSEPSCQRAMFELAPASVSELALNAWGERTLVRLNDTGHLEAGLLRELR